MTRNPFRGGLSDDVMARVIQRVVGAREKGDETLMFDEAMTHRAARLLASLPREDWPARRYGRAVRWIFRVVDP